MKTTVEIPDELFREAKATAARNGAKFKDLLVEGLRLALAKSTPTRTQLRFPLIPGRAGTARLTATKVNEVEAAEAYQEDARDARLGRR